MTADLPAIGVDLGATKIAAALVSPLGEVLASYQALTRPEEGSEAVLDRLAVGIDWLSRQTPSQVAGVGIGSPGLVDHVEGVIRNAVNLGWQEVRLVDGIRTRLQKALSVWVQKDTNASALGELRFGAGQACRDFVYLSIGSGLGGGVIANGRLVTGARGNAAELGHLSLDPMGRPCACGLRGCAETVVSGPGLLTITRELLKHSTTHSWLEGMEELTPVQVVDAACKSDEIALAALNVVGTGLGSVMAACVALLNPARFVIGGGLGLGAFDQLARAARRELERRVTRFSFECLEIVPSCVSSSAVGAACQVWEKG